MVYNPWKRRIMVFAPVCCSSCRPWRLSALQTHARTQSVAASCMGWSPPWSPCARSPSCSTRSEPVSWTWRTEWPTGGVSSAWPTLKGVEIQPTKIHCSHGSTVTSTGAKGFCGLYASYWKLLLLLDHLSTLSPDVWFVSSQGTKLRAIIESVNTI